MRKIPGLLMMKWVNSGKALRTCWYIAFNICIITITHLYLVSLHWSPNASRSPWLLNPCLCLMRLSNILSIVSANPPHLSQPSWSPNLSPRSDCCTLPNLLLISAVLNRIYRYLKNFRKWVSESWSHQKTGITSKRQPRRLFREGGAELRLTQRDIGTPWD